MFLPVSFILSMIPSFDGMSKRAITKLFNTILTRAESHWLLRQHLVFQPCSIPYRLVIRSFWLLFYRLWPLRGIYFKLGDLMSMFSLQSNDSQSVGSRVMRKPRMLMHAHMHRLQRKLGRSMTTLGAGSAIVTGKRTVGFGEFCKDTSRSLPTRRKGKINTWKTYRSNHRYSSWYQRQNGRHC